MGEVASAQLLADEYPDVDFIIPHLGSYADDYGAQLAFTHLLGDRPNLFTDTSGVRRFELLEQAVRRGGPHKVLFGTDGPWLHPALELEKVLLLRLSPRDQALVLSGNFLRLTRTARFRHLRAMTNARPPSAPRPTPSAGPQSPARPAR
jgi:predicted TIM-barrel fold metal-dependent hydrolase